MPIIVMLVVLIVIGDLANTLIPMDQKIKTIIGAKIILLMVFLILSLLFPSFGNFRVGIC
jgi:hypothetical protein